MADTTDPTRRAFRTLNQLVRPLAKAGLASPWPVGPGLVVLETRGRVTGRIREVPLLAYRVGNRLAVSTVRSSSQWVRNLEADDRCAVWYDGRRHPTIAVVERGPVDVAYLRPLR